MAAKKKTKAIPEALICKIGDITATTQRATPGYLKLCIHNSKAWPASVIGQTYTIDGRQFQAETTEGRYLELVEVKKTTKKEDKPE